MEEPGQSAQRLIGHDFHLRFGVRLAAIIAAGVMAIAAILYLFISRNQGKTYYEAKQNIYHMRADVFTQIFASYYTAAIFGLITLAVVVISVRFSHRIAGPLHRLEKGIDALGEGDLTVDIRFRGYDALAQIADETNAAVRLLNHDVRSCQDAMELLCKGEEMVRELLRHERVDAEEIRKAVEAVNVGVAELKRVTGRVKTRE